MNPRPALVLASTSTYRHELLSRLRLPFTTCPSQVDETPRPGEVPLQLARRLALEKALAVAASSPGAVVIGSDQVADLDGEALGKPGHHDGAVRQLRRMSGRTVRFHTALAIVREDLGLRLEDVATVTVHVRPLDDATIERYLRLEQPYDCGGSAKCEGLGIALLAAIESDDPTALVGLPLMRVCTMLARAGIEVLA